MSAHSNITSEVHIVRVAVFVPLRQLFDYRSTRAIKAGCRVSVPFRNRECTGVVIETVANADVALEKLKPISSQIDKEPLLPSSSIRFLKWAAQYYQHPLGEVFATALPSLLRKDVGSEIDDELSWVLSDVGKETELSTLSRAARQQAIFKLFKEQPSVDSSLLTGQSAILKALNEKGLIEQHQQKALPPLASANTVMTVLNSEQVIASKAIIDALKSDSSYHGFLLDGVTGSGKTEVYVHAAAEALAQKKQVLLLVPEIGLTPQLVGRLTDQLKCRFVVFHSGLSDEERRKAWIFARDGDADLIIGTRSSLFVPLPRLGLVMVDEEHDSAFKQQDGFRYSARDLALVRARQQNAVVVLGSATPSLESLHNVREKRLTLLSLKQRAGDAIPPQIKLLDIRGQQLDNGIAPALVGAIQTTVDNNQQALIFLNRRGYAPALLCHSCGWSADCDRCDAHMTLHRSQFNHGHLQCHHCASSRPAPTQCPDCNSLDLIAAGQGTERLEERLTELFPDHNILRVDRDTSRSQKRFNQALDDARSGKADILIGTQMLGKGHDFPNVALVGVLDSDSGLHSVDFRATEKLIQLILQVSGRAGRSAELSANSRVLIQTHLPEHPLMRAITTGDYRQAIGELEQQRKDALWPPFGHLALLRAESADKELVEAFIRNAAELAQLCCMPECHLLGPVPAPLERRQGRWRYQLLFSASERGALQNSIRRWVSELHQLKISHRVRWSLDVDPQELY